jgi:uncharacterized protein DUF6632
MTDNKALSGALVLSGFACLLLYPLSIFWHSGWAWHDGPPLSNDYFAMILAVYATLGIFLIRASRDPAGNASLIWFFIVSSIVHALVMAWEAVRNPMMKGHLVGDVPALLILAAVLAFLMSRRSTAQARLA